MLLPQYAELSCTYDSCTAATMLYHTHISQDVYQQMVLQVGLLFIAYGLVVFTQVSNQIVVIYISISVETSSQV